MQMAFLVASRSTCKRRKVGAVMVRNNRILTTGYNGAPTGMDHCLEIGCLRDELGIPSGEHHELCRGLHAEQNAIIQAALFGISLENSILYCTNQPCVICTKMLINARIKEIYLADYYPDELSSLLLKESKIKIHKIEHEQI
ncbi:cytidine/deoxycytidylate deaminase family protein [bacterium]|nr:cytidine/deoxycytidylate deaminase family protein [bacterium]